MRSTWAAGSFAIARTNPHTACLLEDALFEVDGVDSTALEDDGEAGQGVDEVARQGVAGQDLWHLL